MSDSLPARRPRVAVVTAVFPPSMGGSERYHFTTARALSAAAEVRVLTSEASRAQGDPVRLPGVQVDYLASARTGRETRIRWGPLWRALREFAPDAIWTNGPSATSDLAGLYARTHGVPWVVTYHADLDAGSVVRRVYTWATHRWMRKADRVIVQSEIYRDVERSRGLDARRIVLAPPGPYLLDGSPPLLRESERPTWTSPSPEHPLLFVGGLDPGHGYKRLDLQIDAVAALDGVPPSVSLVVVGEGALRPSLEARVRRAGLTERVRFAGRLSDAELAAMFRRAWALVIPSNSSSEGFAVVALEAAISGCPVVASAQVPGARLLADGGGAICYDAADPTALVGALRMVLTAPDLRDRMAAAALKASQAYRWTALVGSHIDPVLELARRHAQHDGSADATPSKLPRSAPRAGPP